MNKLNNKFQ